MSARLRRIAKDVKCRTAKDISAFYIFWLIAKAENSDSGNQAEDQNTDGFQGRMSDGLYRLFGEN